MSKKRLYNDNEISAVLKRAAELQRGQGPGDTSGLSLTELEQIAAEVGIDPDFVKTAALELETQPADESFNLLGARTSVDLERIIDGDLTEAKWEEAVAEIRRVYDAVGEVGQIGRSREWTYRDQTGERMHVTAVPVEGQTKIRIFTRMSDWAVAMHAPAMSIALVLSIVQFAVLKLGPIVEIGIVLLIFATLHMLARLAYGALARSQERKARNLLGRLDDLFAEPEAPLPERVAPAVPSDAERINPSLLSEEVDPEAAPPLPQRTRDAQR